jgi:hypothetical protein
MTQPVSGTQNTQQTEKEERDILEKNCTAIRGRILSAFAAVNATRSSACKNALRDGITTYLQTVGTPVALQILKNYEVQGCR